MITVTDPLDELMTIERLGPKLTVHAYADRGCDQVVRGTAESSKYALPGSIIAADRVAVAQATANLRFAAGNFYVNDKPTGAVVGQQPFGGGRASGTNEQGWLGAESDALDVDADDQRDVRTTDASPVSAHGLNAERTPADELGLAPECHRLLS